MSRNQDDSARESDAPGVETEEIHPGGYLAIAIVYYRTGNIPWAQIRRNWTVVFVFIGSLGDWR